MPGKTTRLDTGQYLYKTPKGDFILQRSATRRYLRGEGQRGKHVTDWTVISAPEKYRRQAATFSEIGKGLLMDKIDELVATNYEELHKQVERLAMEQAKIANENKLSFEAYTELLKKHSPTLVVKPDHMDEALWKKLVQEHAGKGGGPVADLGLGQGNSLIEQVAQKRMELEKRKRRTTKAGGKTSAKKPPTSFSELAQNYFDSKIHGPPNLHDLTKMANQPRQERQLVVTGPDGTETRIGLGELERQIKNKNDQIAALKKELGKQNNQRQKQLETITTLINQINGLNNTISQLTQTVSKSQEMIQKLIEKSQDQPPRRMLNWAATRREQMPEERQQLIHQWLNGLSDQDLNRVRNEWMHRHTPEPQDTQDEDRPAG